MAGHSAARNQPTSGIDAAKSQILHGTAGAHRAIAIARGRASPSETPAAPAKPYNTAGKITGDQRPLNTAANTRKKRPAPAKTLTTYAAPSVDEFTASCRQGNREFSCNDSLGGAARGYRSRGRRPVCFAMCASIRGPISSPSWNANTKSGHPSRDNVRCEPDWRLMLHPMRWSGARTRFSLATGQRLMLPERRTGSLAVQPRLARCAQQEP